MIQITPQMRVVVAVEPADFRKGIDGLARLCKEALHRDPFSGWVFVFRNRRATAVKVLVYDGQGFWLCHKRLSSGRFRWWPASHTQAAATLAAHPLQVLLSAGNPEAAQAPEGVGSRKYDATAGSILAFLKYGSGMPFNRMEGLQGNLGIPLPASTPWDIVHAQAKHLEPIYAELIRQGADGEVVFNDDTGVKILELMGTCELCEANPLDYLTQLERHADELAANPQRWMPWNYRETLEGMEDAPTPSEENRQDSRGCEKAPQGAGETHERRAD